jgi:hypothetical protein
MTVHPVCQNEAVDIMFWLLPYHKGLFVWYLGDMGASCGRILLGLSPSNILGLYKWLFRTCLWPHTYRHQSH